jgi:hypothetical protein
MVVLDRLLKLTTDDCLGPDMAGDEVYVNLRYPLAGSGGEEKLGNDDVMPASAGRVQVTEKRVPEVVCNALDVLVFHSRQL